MGNTHCTKVYNKNKEKDEGANKVQQPDLCEGKDKENGGGNKRVGKLFCHSKSQKQDARIRRMGKNKTENGNMETMETTPPKKDEPAKAGYQPREGL